MLEELTERHRAGVIQASQDLVRIFSVNQEFLDNVASVSQKLLLEQLEGMGTGPQAREKGLGTLADLEKRCESIASGWQIEMTPRKEEPSKKRRRK